MKNMNAYAGLIKHWAVDRGLDTADPHKQTIKLFEECGEIAEGMAKDDIELTKDGIGDSFVVLVILAEQLGLTIEECVGMAWEEIKDRKGKMINGVFVKDSDLK